MTTYRTGQCVLWSNPHGDLVPAHVIRPAAGGVPIRLVNGTVILACPSNLRPGTGATP